MFKKGKIILIPFPFTDLSSSRVRPAVILSDSLVGDDIVVAFISSRKKKLQKTDIALKKSNKSFVKSGLKVDSIMKLSKIATLDKKIVLGELGVLEDVVLKEVDKKLKILFSL